MKGSTTRTIFYKIKPKDGKDAVGWRVVPSVSSVGVRRDAGGSLAPDVAGVSVRVTRTVGVGTPATIAMDDWNECLVDVNYRWAGESDAQWKSYPMTPVSVNTAKKGLEFRLLVSGTERDRVSVPFVFDGEPGERGSRGAILRGPRAWEDVAVGEDFENGKDDAEFFDVVIHDGEYYSCKTSHSKTATNFPGSRIDNTLGLWQSAANFEFVATRLLLTDYALIKYLGVSYVEVKDAQGNVVCYIKDGDFMLRGDSVILDKGGLQLISDGKTRLSVVNTPVNFDTITEAQTAITIPSGVLNVNYANAPLSMGGLESDTGLYLGDTPTFKSCPVGTGLPAGTEVRGAFSMTLATTSPIYGDFVLRVKKGPIVKLTQLGGFVPDGNTQVARINLNYIVDTTGDYTIELGTRSTNRSGLAFVNTFAVQPSGTSGHRFGLTDGLVVRNPGQKTMIGSDGIMSVWNNTAFGVKEGLILMRVGNHGIKIDETGLYQYNGTGWTKKD